MRHRSVWAIGFGVVGFGVVDFPAPAPHSPACLMHAPQPRYLNPPCGTETKRKPAEDCWSPAGWFFVVYLTSWKRSPSSVIIPRVLPLSHLMWTVPKSSTVLTTPSSPCCSFVYGSDDRKKRTRFPTSSARLSLISMFLLVLVKREVSSRDQTPCLSCLVQTTHLRRFLLCPSRDTKLFR